MSGGGLSPGGAPPHAGSGWPAVQSLRPVALLAVLLFSRALAVAATPEPPRPEDEPCRQALTPDGTAAPWALRWSAPDDPQDLAHLRDWCTTTGPPISAAEPESRSVGAEPLDELVIVTWNVHVGAADVDGFVRRLRAGEFTNGRPANRFVLLLQEVMRKGDEVPRSGAPGVRIPKRVGQSTSVQRHDIVAVAARLGLALHYVPSMRNGTLPSANEDRGNAILSTESLTDLTAIELPFGRQRRVAVAASIALPGSDCAPQMLRLASVHLEVAARPSHLWLFGRIRQRQVRDILGALPADAPLVVAGDFNTWFGFADSAYKVMARAVPDVGARDRRPTFGRWLRLDHVFSRPPAGWSATARRLDTRFGSDHYPILARVRRLNAPTAACGSAP
ncbi:MAG TPA: endonuclease/exonuclease/phosphatase family protein [Vicinamibacterales bacterium]|nr:endonuclease/exonuclease/phosphatase family protein [Vicinamibacterales bacterium]